MKQQGAWIDVWPLIDICSVSKQKEDKQNLHIPLYTKNANKKVSLNSELSDYCVELWKPKAEAGWKSSWIPFVDKINFFPQDTPYTRCALIDCGTMPFYVADGMDKAIEEGKDFAPEQGYVNCLSAGFLTATSDDKVIFQRRAPNIHCPNILIHEPCGYMSSMAFAPRSECDKSKYADDERLFDVGFQLNIQKDEMAKTFGVSSKDIEYNPHQDILACGWKTIEMYFSTTGKINATEKNLKIPIDQEMFFVPFEHLKDLIYNQGRLSKIDPANYRPNDPREIPLIDESLIGLVYGYEKLTGEKIDIPETIDRLNSSGLEITVNENKYQSYDFPTSF